MKKLLTVLVLWNAFVVCGHAQIYDTNNDVVEIFAGSPGTPGYLNAQGTQALFSNPSGVAADSFGNLYVVDASNTRIRQISTNGTVTTFAGGGNGALPGFGTGVALSQLISPGQMIIGQWILPVTVQLVVYPCGDVVQSQVGRNHFRGAENFCDAFF